MELFRFVDKYDNVEVIDALVGKVRSGAKLDSYGDAEPVGYSFT